MKKRAEITRILTGLTDLYPDAECSLDNDGDPFHLFVGAILSAQCTDKRVNETTRTLFIDYPDPQAFAAESEEVIGRRIKSCGLYNAKARALVRSSAILLAKYGGGIPADREALEELPGVGRKIANLMLGEIYKIPAVVVDTHCARVAVRLGLSDKTTPAGIEKDLMACVPREHWITLGHRLVAHGRNLCSARQPKCEICPLREACSYAKAQDTEKRTGKRTQGR